MEENKKKRFFPIYIMGTIVVIMVGSYFIGLKIGRSIRKMDVVKKDNSSNFDTEQNDENSEVDQETLESLLSILGITEEENNRKEHLELFLSEINGVVGDLSAYDKEYLIYYYANSEHMTSWISSSEYKFCDEGNGECEVLSKTNFNEIKRLYGIEEELTDIFPSERIYQNKGLFINNGFIGGLIVKQENIRASYFGKDIVITTDLTINSGDDTTKEMTYVFKLNSENNYYLYSVKTAENV